MVNISFFAQADMTDPPVFFGDATEATSSQFTITEGLHTGIYSGEFTYSGTDVFGILQGYQDFFGGTLVTSASGVNVDFNAFLHLVDQNLIQNAYQLVFAGADTLHGSSSDDVILGYAGDDLMYGGGGNDTIDGGTGSNFAGYIGVAQNYTVTVGPSTISVQDKVGVEATDTLQNIQKLQFADQTVDLSYYTKAAALPAAQFVDLTEMYIAYFNRAPDAGGLDFWGAALHDGYSLQQIAKLFFNAPETVAAYPPGQSTQDFVTEVYTNVLGRAPDAGGMNFWMTNLQQGNIAKDSFMLDIIFGARGAAANGLPADAQYLANKEAVGAHFAIAQGLSNVAWAKTVMAGVDGTAASVTAANNLTDAFAATAATTDGTEFVIKLVGIAA